jgi:hypothetical protein
MDWNNQVNTWNIPGSKARVTRKQMIQIIHLKYISTIDENDRKVKRHQMKIIF